MNGGLLTYLLVSKELTLEEIYANMTEMLLAGVDTVSLLPFFLCTVVFKSVPFAAIFRGVMFFIRT